MTMFICSRCSAESDELRLMCPDCYHTAAGARDVLRWMFRNCKITATVRDGEDSLRQAQVKTLDDVLALMDPRAARAQKARRK